MGDTYTATQSAWARLRFRWGEQVIFVETSATIAAGMEPLNRQGLLEALEGKDVVMLMRKEAKKITEMRVVVTDKWNSGFCMEVLNK